MEKNNNNKKEKQKKKKNHDRKSLENSRWKNIDGNPKFMRNLIFWRFQKMIQ